MFLLFFLWIPIAIISFTEGKESKQNKTTIITTTTTTTES